MLELEILQNANFIAISASPVTGLHNIPTFHMKMVH